MLEVIKPGMMTSIQDAGRQGFQNKGIAVSGAMDMKAYQLANVLVDNDLHAPCLEIAYIGPKIIFHTNLEIAVTGALFAPTINGKPVNINETLYIQKGDVLDCGVASKGVFAYISFSKKMDLPPLLSSYATTIKEKNGGLKGRFLIAGDRINLRNNFQISYLEKRKAPTEFCYPYENPETIGFIAGQEFSRFKPNYDKEGLIHLEVTEDCNRIGYRLSGEALSPNDADIISEGLSKGTIQGTKSGEWIVLLSEHQSIGGYPRFGYVISDDISSFVHLRPKEKVCLKMVSLEEADLRRRAYCEKLAKWSSLLPKRTYYTEGVSKQFEVSVNQNKYTVQVTLVEEI